MTWNTLKIDWLDFLSRKRKLQKAVSVRTIDALKITLDNGGYVTGGFARSFAYALLNEDYNVIKPSIEPGDKVHEAKADGDAYLQLHKYLGSGSEVDPSPARWPDPKFLESRLWKRGVGDIDVFFNTRQGADAAVGSLKSSSALTWIGPTIAGYGQEYVIDKRNVLQIITKVTGHQQDVLDSFDLANAAVYFDSDGLHYTDSWVALESNNQLGIERCDKPNLLWRVHKWKKRHSYSKLRPGDEEKYVDALFVAYDKAKTTDWKMWNNSVTPSAVSRLGWQFSNWLPPSELLRASLIFDGYHQLYTLQSVAKKLGGVVSSMPFGPVGPRGA